MSKTKNIPRPAGGANGLTGGAPGKGAGAGGRFRIGEEALVPVVDLVRVRIVGVMNGICLVKADRPLHNGILEFPVPEKEVRPLARPAAARVATPARQPALAG